MSDLLRALLEMLGVAISTFVGAFAAFRLESKHKTNEGTRQKESAVRRAQFALSCQLNMLEMIRRQHLESMRTDPNRHLLLKPITHSQQVPEVELDSLLFILESDEPNLLNEIQLCQNEFANVIGVLDVRSAEHRRFQELVSIAERTGQLLPVDQANQDILGSLVGNDLIAGLRDLTNQLYSSLDSGLAANRRVYDRLSASAKTVLPKLKLLGRAET